MEWAQSSAVHAAYTDVKQLDRRIRVNIVLDVTSRGDSSTSSKFFIPYVHLPKISF